MNTRFLLPLKRQQGLESGSKYRNAHICAKLVLMRSRGRGKTTRRKPKQRRARQTVQAILDAVLRILKRERFDKITTNHIAEVAGVSIGSLYQYFPDKRAIFAALHGRHIEEIDGLIQRTLLENASSSLEGLLRAVIDAMIEAHAGDPALYHLLFAEVPHRADGAKEFAVRLHGVFRLAIAARAQELRKGRNLDALAFVTANMVESLSHAALFQRSTDLSLTDRKKEILRAVLSYLHS